MTSFCLPSPHQLSLSLLWSPLMFYLQKCWNNIFVIKCNQIGPLQECVIEVFFMISFRLLTVVKSSIGQGTRICSNPSRVVTCFCRFHNHGSQHQSPVLIYNHLILKHLRKSNYGLQSCEFFLRFLKHLTGSNGFILERFKNLQLMGS